MKRKIRISILTLLLLSILVAGSSMAYFTDTAEVSANTFVIGEVEIRFKEEPEIDAESSYVERQKVTWGIENTGNSDVFLRVKPSDEVTSHVQNLHGDISLSSWSDDWVEGKDSYYYHPLPLGPEDHVSFILAVNFDMWEPVENFPVDIEVEAVQAANEAISEKWPDNPFH